MYLIKFCRYLPKCKLKRVCSQPCNSNTAAPSVESGENDNVPYCTCDLYLSRNYCRMTVLPDSEDRMIVSSFVWTKHWNVTDRGTDRQRDRKAVAIIALALRAMRKRCKIHALYSRRPGPSSVSTTPSWLVFLRSLLSSDEPLEHLWTSRPIPRRCTQFMTHRRSQDFVWGCTFPDEKSDALFGHHPLIHRYMNHIQPPTTFLSVSYTHLTLPTIYSV